MLRHGGHGCGAMNGDEKYNRIVCESGGTYEPVVWAHTAACILEALQLIIWRLKRHSLHRNRNMLPGIGCCGVTNCCDWSWGGVEDGAKGCTDCRSCVEKKKVLVSTGATQQDTCRSIRVFGMAGEAGVVLSDCVGPCVLCADYKEVKDDKRWRITDLLS
jgi:hypothetical protein